MLGIINLASSSIGANSVLSMELAADSSVCMMAGLALTQESNCSLAVAIILRNSSRPFALPTFSFAPPMDTVPFFM